jgi:hypothetical protein
MAKSRSAKKGRRSKTTRSRRRSRAAGNGSSRDDAISLLKADHREAERLFSAFESARSEERKQEIAAQVCAALKAHTTIEEEIFYPAFLEATEETDIHHEAEIEHQGATHLIQEIESAGADDHFDARISVLEEMVKHHVNEEEKRGGMFSKAQNSDMDLVELGRQLRERKLELVGEESGDMAPSGRRPPRRRPNELRVRSS